MTKFTSYVAAVSIAIVGGAVSAQERQFVNVGTAGVGGGYYPAGGFICNVLNKSRKDNNHAIRCTVESTAGSVANLRSIRAGELDVAFAQADWQHHSFNGTSKFEEDGADADLRFLFSLQAEPMHIVTRPEADIDSFEDLKGKAVNTGNAGSGTEATVYAALAAYGETADSYFGQEAKLTSREQAQALCDGKIDAFFFPVGIGTSSIVEAMSTCDAELASWDDETIRKMVKDAGFFGLYTIPAESYPGQTEDINTWGMPATVVASANADDEVIYMMMKAVFDNFEEFTQQSTLFVGLTREGAVANGQSAPFHDGAQRYLKEVGLLD